MTPFFKKSWKIISNPVPLKRGLWAKKEMFSICPGHIHAALFGWAHLWSEYFVIRKNKHFFYFEIHFGPLFEKMHRIHRKENAIDIFI